MTINSSPRAARGFTVIELLIVLVITGVMMSIGVPKLRAALRQRAVRAAGNEFVLAHSFARSAALRFARESRLYIDGTTASFWVTVDTSGFGARDTVGLVHNLADKGIQINSNRAVLCFDARGLATINATCNAGDAQVVMGSLTWADTTRITTLGKVLR